MLRNIPTDLLRAFVTVVDLGGYTRAAEALGRTQPAVSLQIRRLEELLQSTLLRVEGRQVRLTDAGLALGPHARQMLRLNDDIIAHFAEESLSGWIKVGLPTDFSHTFLLTTISRFAATHPQVRIEVESRISSELRKDLAADRLDLILAIAGSGQPSENQDAFLVSSTSVQPFWAVAEQFVWSPREPLPIVRHPDPCEYAERMRSALRLSRKTWRTVMIARDVAGLQAAIIAGLGVSAMTPATLSDGMRIGTPEEGFPALAPLRIGLFYKHARLTKAGHGLAQWLVERIEEAGGGASR